MGTMIGLDVGSSAVRAVQVTTKSRGPAALERIGQVMLPPGAVRDGEILQPDVVVEALRTLWSSRGFKSKKVALGVANQQVVVRQIDLPYLPEAELRKSLQFQVQDYIPIPVEQAILDFHVLEHYETEDAQRYSRVLLVAAHRDMVTNLIEVVRRAKLEPVSLDLDAFALLRSLPASAPIEGREGELLIDVGASVTNILVHEAGIPRFIRILLMGGNTITEGIMGGLGISHEEAESAKVATGLMEAERIPADNEAARLIAERAGRFIDEIRGSLDYYAAQADSVPVRRVMLSGGASQLHNLQERLENALRVTVERGHPMQELKIGNVGFEPEQLVEAEPYLAVAIGLALGAAA